MDRAVALFCCARLRICDRISYSCSGVMPAITVLILSCAGPVYGALPSSELACVAAALAASRPMGCGAEEGRGEGGEREGGRGGGVLVEGKGGALLRADGAAGQMDG